MRTAAVFICALHFELQRLKTPMPSGLPEAGASGSDTYRGGRPVSRGGIYHCMTTGTTLCRGRSDRTELTICQKTRSMYLSKKNTIMQSHRGICIRKPGIYLSKAVTRRTVSHISGSQSVQQHQQHPGTC